MTTTGTGTAHAVSPDSGEHWSVEGAWQVADDLYRIPLPLATTAARPSSTPPSDEAGRRVGMWGIP